LFEQEVDDLLNFFSRTGVRRKSQQRSVAIFVADLNVSTALQKQGEDFRGA
jgi:hypothetical protein